VGLDNEQFSSKEVSIDRITSWAEGGEHKAEKEGKREVEAVPTTNFIKNN